MSTPFNVQKWARQAGIQMTGGFCVVAECVTVDELERFANNVIDGMALAQTQEQKPQIAFNAEVVGYVAPQRVWEGLTDEERADCWCTSAAQTTINIEAKLKEKNT